MNGKCWLIDALIAIRSLMVDDGDPEIGMWYDAKYWSFMSIYKVIG